MELSFDHVYMNNLSNLFLPGFVAVSISFASAGLKGLKSRESDSLIYILISLFFIAAHFYFLFDHALRLPFGSAFVNVSAFAWFEYLLAPTTILVFLLSGIFAFYKTRFKNGLIRIFFGLTLYCYFYMLDIDWPIQAKAALVLLWLMVLFYLEIRPVEEKPVSAVYLRT